MMLTKNKLHNHLMEFAEDEARLRPELGLLLSADGVKEEVFAKIVDSMVESYKEALDRLIESWSIKGGQKLIGNARALVKELKD
jgi:hypothetical protein